MKQPSLTDILSRNLPLPKYFSSTASSAQYHLPRKNPHAFSSYVSNAGEANDLAERFVVGWIEVEADIEPDVEVEEKKVTKRLSGGHIGMGSREERRSFGSDATSRTATPTFRADTPTMGLPRQSSNLGHTRSTSGRARVKTPVPKAVKKIRIERQLVAITFSGDWYRLRIPDQPEELDVEGKRKGKCELVEYRRLGVGGGGW